MNDPAIRGNILDAIINHITYNDPDSSEKYSKWVVKTSHEAQRGDVALDHPYLMQWQIMEEDNLTDIKKTLTAFDIDLTGFNEQPDQKFIYAFRRDIF